MVIDTADIANRLATFGYYYTEADSWVIEFIIDKVTNHICNNCNLYTIPDALREQAIDMVCGEFLKGKYSRGELDISSVVSSIKEGDTQVNFASGGTPEEIFITYINGLTSTVIDYARFRKMNWE